jgi:23S rRNA C2498 (ribose-2'-O)-methylase RlmM
LLNGQLGLWQHRSMYRICITYHITKKMDILLQRNEFAFIGVSLSHPDSTIVPPLSYVHEPPSISLLQSTNILQQCRQFSLYSLQIRISSNVFFVDVDIGNGGLTIDFLQRSLNVGSIIYSIKFISTYPYLSKVDIYIPT